MEPTGLSRCRCRSPFLAVALLLGCMLPLSAQSLGTVAGVVTDSATAEPIRGIQVQAPGTRSVAVTDSEGRFVLRELPAGPQTLHFTWFGYQERTLTATVTPGREVVLNVQMAPAPLRLGEVLVTTVSRRPERVLESPAAVSSVTAARIRDLRATGQAPLLVRDLPGVYVMQSGINSFSVNSRSFNALLNRRMLVLVDGRDVSVPIVGTQEWAALSILEDAATVEVVRGPSSALYGADAYSGVLNITTPSVRQALGSRLTLSGGDPLSVRVDARHGMLSDDLRWGASVRGGYARSRSWDRSRTDVGDLAAEYEGVIGADEVMAPAPGFEPVPLTGQTSTTPFGTPGPVTGTPDPEVTYSGSARVDRYLDGGGVVTAEGGFTLLENQVGDTGSGRSQVSTSKRPWARFAWATSDLNVMANYTARGADQRNLSTGMTFEDFSSRWHAEAQKTFSFPADRGSLVIGTSFRSEKVDSKGTLFPPEFDGRVDEYYAVFGQADVRLLPSLRLIAAARVDDSSLFDAKVSPKVGLLWSVRDDQSVRLTFGQAYMTPTTVDRFLRIPLGPPQDLSALEAGLRMSPLGPALLGVPDGTLLTQTAAVPVLAIGDASRRPEEVTAYEVGYKGQFNRVYVGIDVHRTHHSGFATSLLPGIHPDFAPWTAPSAVPEPARGAVEEAVRSAVPGVTRLEDGASALVFSSATAGEATQWGTDLTLGILATDRLRFDANYSYVTVDFEEGSFLGGDSIPTNTPTHTANLSTTYATPDGLSVRLGLRLVDEFNFQMALLQGRVPSRQSVDLSVAYDLTADVAATLSVTNLLDQKRYHYFGGSLIRRRALVAFTWSP